MKNIKLFERYISQDDSRLGGINEGEALLASELFKSLDKGPGELDLEGSFLKQWTQWIKYQSDMADLMLEGNIGEEQFKKKILEITSWLKKSTNAQTVAYLYYMKDQFQKNKTKFPLTSSMYDLIDIKIPKAVQF